jgi:hypothetical protein
MNDSTSPNSESIKSALGSIERATEPKIFFLFSAFVFALDSGLNLVTQKNLYTISPGIKVATLDWGKLLLFLLVFSFLMAFAMKIMRYLIEEIISHPAISIAVWLRIKSGGERSSPDESERHPSAAIKIAQDRGDKLLYEIAKAADDKYWQRLQGDIEKAQMAFSTLVFMLLNRYAAGDAASPRVLRLAAEWSEKHEGPFQFIYAVFWLVVIMAWLSNTFMHDIRTEWVYIPKEKPALKDND